MSERKVQNKYYPPIFDPAKIPRQKRPKNQQIKVRMMLPMSIRCGTCGTYIYKGTKFNSRKEDCVGEKYLGIQILRFYIKCSRCSAEITFKTDPRNSDYAVESGASRNFEPWREESETVDREKRKREAEEMGDAMRALENRANDSKRDMDKLAGLEEIRSMKSRHEGVSVDEMLKKQSARLKEGKTVAQLNEEDEKLIRSTTFRNSEDYVRRIQEGDEDFGIPDRSSVTAKIIGSSESVLNPADVSTKTNVPGSADKQGGNKTVASSNMPKFIVKPKPVHANPQKKQKTELAAVQDMTFTSGASEENTNVLQSLCHYDSDESDD